MPVPQRKRRQPRFVLEILVPTLLGGLTVFGVYWFVLPDSWKPGQTKPKQNVRGQHVEDSPAVAAAGQDLDSQQNRPLPDRRQAVKTRTPPNKNGETRQVHQDVVEKDPPVLSRDQQEQLARNALQLAEKMAESNKSKAKKWFERVIEKYPNSEAAETARDWIFANTK